MKARTLIAVGLAVGAIAPWAVNASAQTGGAPAQQPQNYYMHANIPGVCVFSAGDVITQSKVGQSVFARLKMLDQQWREELKPENDAINTAAGQLEAGRAALSQAEYQAQEATLQLRATNFEKRIQQRQEEMQATQQRRVNDVKQQLAPILAQIADQRQCAIVIERDTGGVFSFNQSMDISAAALAALDLKIQSLTFDREHLDTQPPPAGGGAR